MAKQILREDVWEQIEPHLPKLRRRRKRYPGRKPIGNREVLTGILYVLMTGIPWEYLPQEMGCGSGMTCWRRLRDWQRQGVWDKIHVILLHKLQRADKIDWSRAVVDSSSVRAVFGGIKRDPTQRIGGKTARNTTSSRTPKAFRFLLASLPPIKMT